MEVRNSSKREENILSDETKIMLINLMFQFRKGNDFSISRDRLKAFQSATKQQLIFIDEIYDTLQKIGIDGDINKREYREQVMEKLYKSLQVSSEVMQEVRKASDSANQQGKAGDKEDKELGTKAIQLQEAKNEIPYKMGLYQPELLCRQPNAKVGEPFVKLVRYPVERQFPIYSYQFAGRTYDIKKTGELFYMSTPNLQESISEYEITISMGNVSRTIKRFGEIFFSKMEDPAYNAMLFLQLLGITNLTDKELHGYMGSLSRVVDTSRRTNGYRVTHLPEQYTAVITWEKMEKESMQERENGKRIINLESARRGKVSGGNER